MFINLNINIEYYYINIINIILEIRKLKSYVLEPNSFFLDL